jgi:uncharacterized damage-inducible protein DinB
MLNDFAREYRRYRLLGEKALKQMPDAALNHVASPEGNSAAMIVRHVSGNLTSRFTDFLTSDGEKPWRDRESEFAQRSSSRAEVEAMWAEGFAVLATALDSMTDADLARSVTIRGEALTVHAALARSVSHLAYHVGQLVLLARELADRPWESLSIPRGQSAAYNAAPTLERGPRS